MIGYAASPTRRRWLRANFGHVLGVSPKSPEAGRMARAAYRNYARYVMELMRLPWLKREQVDQLLEVHSLDRFLEIYRESKGVVLVAAHLGNNEAAAAGLRQAWPRDQRGRRRLLLPRAVRAVRAPADELGRQDDLLAQPPRRLRSTPPPRGPGPAGGLGLSSGRHPGQDVRGLDDAAGRARRCSPQSTAPPSCPSRSTASPTAPSRRRPTSRSTSPRTPRRTWPSRPRRSPLPSRATSPLRRSSGTTSSRSGPNRRRRRRGWRPETARRWQTTPGRGSERGLGRTLP